MSEPDLGGLLARAREMQGRMAELQKDLARRTVEGSAGGGMVTARVSGEMRVLEVRIEPSLIQSGDQGMLQDLVAAAVNAGLESARQMMQQEMQRAAGAPLAEIFGGGSGGASGS